MQNQKKKRIQGDRYVNMGCSNQQNTKIVKKHVHSQALRHTFPKDLYRETGKIRLVQKALGHADLSTTMIYTHIVDDELEIAFQSFRNAQDNPFEQIFNFQFINYMVSEDEISA